MTRSGAETEPQAVDARFRDALRVQRDGVDLARASELYREILRQRPDHYGSLINLGVLEFERGKMHEAVRLFTRAQRIHPSATECCFNLGKALFQLGDLKAAQRNLEMAYESSPEDLAILAELGRLYVETERFSAARALALHGIRALEHEAEPRILLAKVHLALGELHEGLELLEELLVQRPDLAEGFRVQAQLRYLAGDSALAAASIRRALLIQPQHAESHRLFGIYLSAQGLDEEANAAFFEAKRLDPKLRLPKVDREPEESRDAWERLQLQSKLLERSRSYAQARRFKAGIADFLALTARYPGEAVVWQELGWFYEKLQEPKRALNLYRKAGDLDGRNLEVRLRSGHLELDLGRPERAQRWIEEVEKLGYGDLPEVLELRARSFLLQGQPERGKSFYERALTQVPNRLSALKGIGSCLLESGDEEGAIEVWTKSFRAHPSDPKLCLELAELLVSREEPASAEKVLRAGIERNLEAREIHVRLARLLLSEARFAAAEKVYRNICRLGPPETLEQALDNLEALLYCKETKLARRWFRQIKRLRSRQDTGARFALFEAVSAVHARDRHRFSTAWQRAWHESPTLDQYASYLRGVFGAADFHFFQEVAQESSTFLARDPERRQGLTRLGEKLSEGGRLKSLPSHG